MTDNGKPLHTCLTKATAAEPGGPRHSFNWVVARRARLHVYPDRLVCGDWVLPYAEFDDVVLYRTRSGLMIRGYVLCVTRRGKVYQFGLNPGRFWAGELPFEARRESMRMGYSPFSVVVRFVLFAALAYVLWRTYGR